MILTLAQDKRIPGAKCPVCEGEPLLMRHLVPDLNPFYRHDDLPIVAALDGPSHANRVIIQCALCLMSVTLALPNADETVIEEMAATMLEALRCRDNDNEPNTK